MLSVYNKEQFVDLLCKSNDSNAPAVNFWEQAVYALNNMPKYYGKEVIIKKVIHYTGSYSDILYLTLGQNFIALYVVPVEKDIGCEQGILSDNKNLLLTVYKDHIDIFDYRERYRFNWYSVLNGYILSIVSNGFSSSTVIECVNNRNTSTKENSALIRMENLESRFKILFMETHLTLNRVISILKGEGYEDNEIYNTIISVLGNTKWGIKEGII